MRKLALILSAGLGLGYIPWAPGTFGTLWGLLLFYLLRSFSWQIFAAVTVAAILFAVWVSHLAETELKSHDSSHIVIDEVVGYMVTVVAFPFSPGVAVAAFILFRFFDILKPFPIRLIDRRVGGGWGVVLDDVAAGVFANLVLRFLVWGSHAWGVPIPGL